jgi:hypothetical protein
MLALRWRASLTRAANARYLTGNCAYTTTHLAGMQARRTAGLLCRQCAAPGLSQAPRQCWALAARISCRGFR